MRAPKIYSLWFLLVASFSLSGCITRSVTHSHARSASPETSPFFQRVMFGMTRDEVYRIVGQPHTLDAKNGYEIWHGPDGNDYHIFFSPSGQVAGIGSEGREK